MAGKISSFPGKNCISFVQGRCLYEERLNPGWKKEWRCKVLVAWEAEYDRFLTQADVFDLDINVAARIWEQRLHSIVQSKNPCDLYEPVLETWELNKLDEIGLDESTVCVHAWIGLCLLELPKCEGICTLFAPRTETKL